jgi:hypothetical protein
MVTSTSYLSGQMRAALSSDDGGASSMTVRAPVCCVAGVLCEYTFYMSIYLIILVFFCCADLIVHFVHELYGLSEGSF